MRLLKFYTDFCRPCKVLAPILEELCNELGVDCESINATEDERGVTFDIRSVPTIVAMDGDNELGRFSGMRAKDDIKLWIESHM